MSISLLSYFPCKKNHKRICAFYRSGSMIAGTRCGLGITQLTTQRIGCRLCARRKHTCAGELSPLLTQTLLEGNKAFSSLYPKIEKGETILLQVFAEVIRETNRNHSQLLSSSFSSSERCLSCSSADAAHPTHPVPSLQGREEQQQNL